MDAHHLLPWWDHGFIPAHMSVVSKKRHATLIVLQELPLVWQGHLTLTWKFVVLSPRSLEKCFLQIIAQQTEIHKQMMAVIGGFVQLNNICTT